jgi:hypothetical protein
MRRATTRTAKATTVNTAMRGATASFRTSDKTSSCFLLWGIGGPFFDSHSETADEDEYGGCAAKAVSDLAHSIEKAHCSTPNPRTEQRDIA